MTELANLTELILDRAARRPDARFGMADARLTLSDAVVRARRTAGALGDAGIAPGARVAVVGETSTSYLLTWMALVFAGAEPALINPTYPADLLEQMLVDIVAVPPTDAKGQAIVPEWEADYRILLADRYRYADMLASGKDGPFTETAVQSVPVTERIETFAGDNLMPSCAPPRGSVL